MITLLPRLRPTSLKSHCPSLPVLCLGLLIAGLVLLAWTPLSLILSKFPQGFNEGWNAYWAIKAIAGQALYPPPDDLLVNNYPPLSFYLIGYLSQFTHDAILTGRVLSCIAMGVISADIYGLCREFKTTQTTAFFAALLFPFFILILAADYFAADDPHLLALAFIVTGGWLWVRQQNQGKRGFWACGLPILLMFCGGFIKHTAISLPLALLLSTYFDDRKRFWLSCGWSLFFASIGFGWIYALGGTTAFHSLFLTPRLVSFAFLWTKLGTHCLYFPFLYLILIGLTDFSAFARRDVRFWKIYTVLSFGFGYFMVMGDGVFGNDLFDAFLAVCLGVAFLISSQETENKKRVCYFILLFPLVLATLRNYVVPNYQYTPIVRHREQDSTIPDPTKDERASLRDMERDWSTLIQKIGATRYPVACSVLAVCYWAHKDYEIDFFDYGQKLYTKATTPDLFIQRLRAKYYAYLVIEPKEFTLDHPRLPPDVMSEILKNYHPIQLLPHAKGNAPPVRLPDGQTYLPANIEVLVMAPKL